MEPAPAVKRVGVLRDQHPASEALVIGMCEREVNHGLGKAAATVWFIDPHVGEVGKGRAVGDDAKVSDLLATHLVVRPDHER